MRILIVSDTHRRHGYLMEALERVQPIDLLIHLGDAEGEEEEIALLAEWGAFNRGIKIGRAHV